MTTSLSRHARVFCLKKGEFTLFPTCGCTPFARVTSEGQRADKLGINCKSSRPRNRTSCNYIFHSVSYLVQQVGLMDRRNAGRGICFVMAVYSLGVLKQTERCYVRFFYGFHTSLFKLSNRLVPKSTWTRANSALIRHHFDLLLAWRTHRQTHTYINTHPVLMQPNMMCKMMQFLLFGSFIVSSVLRSKGKLTKKCGFTWCCRYSSTQLIKLFQMRLI